MHITNKILLALRFELTHQSHCYFLLLDRGVAVAIRTPYFEVEEEGCRQRPPSVFCGLGGPV